MKAIASIRQLYAPVQPTVKRSADDVMYTELLPDLHLQDFIYCYWELKTTQALSEEFNYRVVADGCMDVFFEMHQTSENFVMGFSKHYTEFPLGKSFHYVGIRFLPATFPQLFRISAAELSNRMENLNVVIPGLSQFIASHFHAGQKHHEIKKHFDRYFKDHLSRTALEPDNRFYEAVHIILKKQGALNIETDLDTGISPRQLRRLFAFYIGDTAKTFSKVVRFQNILRTKPSLQSLRENKLFFDNGYYDQSHFIKEFKNFYGVTPGKVF